jgi:hypothetical protein
MPADFTTEKDPWYQLNWRLGQSRAGLDALEEEIHCSCKESKLVEKEVKNK